MKEVFLLRGLPGSGKSTVALSLLHGFTNAFHVEADQYFTDHDGNYNFNPNVLKNAHDDCLARFKAILRENVFASHCRVIVSNTSTRLWEFQEYKTLAEQAGFRVHVLIVENWDGRRNTHDVPHTSLVAMQKRFELCLYHDIMYARKFTTDKPAVSPAPPNDESLCQSCGVEFDDNGHCLCTDHLVEANDF